MLHATYSRTDAGLPVEVLNSDGTPRPLLAPSLGILTIHYTGANTTYAGKDTAAVLRQLNVIFAESKPNEYNWVVDQQGAVWEYAGDHQAAHSKGNNERAIGCLTLVGVGEYPTDACVDAIRYLRFNLIARARLAPNCQTIKHKDMGTTVTSCPGAAVEARWPEILQSWRPATPPPPLEHEEDDDVAQGLYKFKGGNAWFTCDPDAGTFVFQNASVIAAGLAVNDYRVDKNGAPGIIDEKTVPQWVNKTADANYGKTVKDIFRL